MTDDERIAEIEEYHRRYFPMPNVSLHVEDLLRIIRSLQAELVHARRVIAYMRGAYRSGRETGRHSS